MDKGDVEMVFGTPKSPKGARLDIHNETEKNHSIKRSDDTKPGTEKDFHPNQPLLESEKAPQYPPLAGPEIDDLDEIPHADSTLNIGNDDGHLGDNPKEHDSHGSENPEHNGSDHSTREGDAVTDDGKWIYADADETDYPYGSNHPMNGMGLSSRFNADDRPGSPTSASGVDFNTYQQKKDLAQGMMDLALLSANANQLRYVIESAPMHPYYYPSITFIALSIVLQVAVGVGLIMNSKYKVTDKVHCNKADRINNFTVLGVFLITIVNVFITSFSVATPPAAITSINVETAGSG